MATQEKSKLLFHINNLQHGSGPVVVAWQAAGNYVATAGSNRQVHIYDRYGQVVADVSITAGGAIMDMQWDSEGETLTIMQQTNSALFFWDVATRKTNIVETNMKDLSWMRWNTNGPELAVGTAKGNLVLYNKRTTRISQLLGKHTKRISGGSWTVRGQLVLISDDRSISINEASGDLVRQEALKQLPNDVFCPHSGTGQHARSELISVLLANKSVLVMNFDQSNPPIELTFVPKYGEVTAHRWLTDDFLVIGFSGGWVSVVSPRSVNAGANLFASQIFRSGVTDVRVCASMRRVAVCGDRTVRFIDCVSWKEIPEDTIQVPGTCDKLLWTVDGSVLSVGTTDGHVYNYLARMPVMNAAYGTMIAYLSSLREVVVKDVAAEDKTLAIAIEMEPSFMGLGRNHVALGMNNMCWFYACDRNGAKIAETQYLATVEDVKVSATKASVRYDGRIQLHAIVGDPDGKRTRTFPEEGDDERITCHHLTEQFLIYGTSRGTLVYYSIEDDAIPNEYRHELGIQSIYPNAAGTRLVMVDDGGVLHLYNPVDSSLMEVPKYPRDVQCVLWDMFDRTCFVVCAVGEYHTYIYTPISISGPCVSCVGTTERMTQDAPVVLNNGAISCQTASGSVSKSVLSTHNQISHTVDEHMRGGRTPDRQFAQALALGRLEEAQQYAGADAEASAQLLNKAMSVLDVQTASLAAGIMGNVGMVMSLNKLATVEDKNLLAGNMAMFTGDYSLAQDLLLSSSRPISALEMRADLMQWEPAIRLAETLDPQRIPSSCLQYAEQLQALSEYEGALERYQQAMQGTFTAMGTEVRVRLSTEHNVACKAGAARMHMKLGNTTKGFQLAVECGDAVCVDCASILEGAKQYGDAALLYEKGKNYEKAANLYITKLKDYKAATPLLAKVSTPKLHVLFAQAQEKGGHYREAAESFERGKDLDSVVRLYLTNLNEPQKACSIVRETRSKNGAADIARHCQGQSDFRTAIEFLIIAKENDKAAEIAREHDLMDSFASFLKNDGTKDEYVAIAKYYKSKSQAEKAGEFYEKAGNYTEALKLFLSVGEQCIDHAIEVVGQARNDVLTHTLVDYLMGEHDNKEKDPKFIHKLYMTLGNYPQAARTGVIIAKKDMQEEGKYKAAHKLLFDIYRDLDSGNIPIPRELEETLMLLHSYVLVKVLVKMGDHEAGARMLIRAAKNISKFPKHLVPILTSTVIECQRANLKKTSFEYASMLMRPEYRPQIAEQYKKKIESIVRKPTKQEDEEPVTPCPYCALKSPCSMLDCVQCKNRVPYCIATGLRMVANDWTHCPSCHFPALFSKFKALIDSEGKCPMCEQEVQASSIVKVENPEEFLNRNAKQVAP